MDYWGKVNRVIKTFVESGGRCEASSDLSIWYAWHDGERNT